MERAHSPVINHRASAVITACYLLFTIYLLAPSSFVPSPSIAVAPSPRSPAIEIVHKRAVRDQAVPNDHPYMHDTSRESASKLQHVYPRISPITARVHLQARIGWFVDGEPSPIAGTGSLALVSYISCRGRLCRVLYERDRYPFPQFFLLLLSSFFTRTPLQSRPSVVRATANSQACSRRAVTAQVHGS